MPGNQTRRRVLASTGATVFGIGSMSGCLSDDDQPQEDAPETEPPADPTAMDSVNTGPRQCTARSLDPMTYRSVIPRPDPAALPPAYDLQLVRPAAAVERVGGSDAYADFHDRDIPEFPTVEPCDIHLSLTTGHTTGIYGTFDTETVADAMDTDQAQRLDDRHGFARFYFHEFNHRTVAVGDRIIFEAVRGVYSNAIDNLNHQIDVFAGATESYAERSPFRTIEPHLPQGVFTSLESGELLTSSFPTDGDHLTAAGQTAQFADSGDGLDLRSVFLFDETASDLRDHVDAATSGYGSGRELRRFPVNSPTITREGRIVIVDDHTTFEDMFGRF